jgi:hypothetical protein
MTVVEEQLVAPVASTVLFMSRRSDLRLVKVPRYPQFGAGGMKVGEQPGEAVEFREGRLDVPVAGKMELADGRKVNAQEIHDWLVGNAERDIPAHRLLGDVEGGFWRVDPVAPPVSEEELNRVTDATLDLDVATLREIMAQEEAGWNRDTLLNVARRQIDKIEAIRVEMEAQRAEAEAAEAKSKPGPKPKTS